LSSFAIFRSAFKSQGIAGIYAGSPALIASNTAKGGVRFFSFESSKSVLEPVMGPNSVFVNILAGLSGGIAESILVVTPAEVVKTQSIDMAAAGVRAESTLGVAGRVVRIHGLLGLWRGVGPVVCKQGTNSAVRFASYGAIKDWVGTTSLGRRLDNAGSTLLAGALSGAVTTSVSKPY
jgi:solute carrier family 25 citrate transporter 1